MYIFFPSDSETRALELGYVAFMDLTQLSVSEVLSLLVDARHFACTFCIALLDSRTRAMPL